MNATTDTTPTTASTANRMGRNPFAKPAVEAATPKARVLKTQSRTVAAEEPITFSRVLRFLTVTLPVGSIAIGLDLLRERLTSKI